MSKVSKEKKLKNVDMSGPQVSIKSWKAWLYLAPALTALAVFVIYPLIKVLRMGFYQKYVYLTDEGTGFGLDSFKFVLSDPVYHLALKNTCIIVFVGVPITIFFSLGVAVMINSLIKGKGFFQSLYFLPYVTSTIAVGVVFMWLFHSDYGFINFFLSFLGVSPKKWMTDPNMVVWSVTIFTIWNGMAFKIVLFLAGLQKIDKQYYQAARIDGTSRRRTFLKITLPLLSPTLWMVVMISVIHAFKTYNEIYSMFGNSAGPGNTAITVVYYIYNMFYVKGQVHYAAASALIFLIIVMTLTIIQKLITKRFTHYN